MVTRKGRAAPALDGMPRASGMVARGAYARAREAGVALAPLLAKARITAAQLEDPRAAVPAANQIRLLSLAADALGDDLFGFHVARDAELRQVGLLYFVMSTSTTVFEALRRGVRYWSLANEGIEPRCNAGRTLDVSLHYLASSPRHDRHHTECFATIMVKVLRELTGTSISPVRVRFTHSRPACPPELARYFAGAIEFGARADDLRFDRRAGETRITTADPYLNRLLVGYSEQALLHRGPVRAAFRSRVENALVPLLPHAEARASEVAARMGVSERTLSRRLAEEDVTFTAVLDALRLDLARRYLADAGTSISRVAWLLGYREPAAFSKAFRRWTGTTPRDARELLKAPPRAPANARRAPRRGPSKRR
jgi:AraC-like DNA-binding protein